MSFLSRVLRNIARSKVRTIGLILVVAVSLAAFLILSQIDASISGNVGQARAAVKNIVTVQPAGGSGFFDPTAHVSDSIVPTVQDTSGVQSVQRVLLNPSGTGSGGGSGDFRNFTLYEGVDTTSPINLFGGFGGGSSVSIVSGRELDSGDENSRVAMIGETYADDNGLSTGNTLSINGSSVSVVGVFTTGSRFGGNTVILPYPAAQSIFGASGPNLLYVTVVSTGSVDAVVSALQSALGSSYAVTALGQNNGGSFEDAINSILSNSQLEEYAALAVGAAIMVLVMILLTSQRIREIGLLKAFGFSNGRILSQLLAESVLLSVAGLPVALLITVWIGPTVAQDVIGSAAGGFGGGPVGGRFVARFLGNVDFSITPGVVLLGVAVTFAFGVIGAAYPIVRALRSRPSEILRHE